MKVLMAAYSCRPDRGSEGAVGWRWATELAHTHEVHVVTNARNREPIEQATSTGEAAGVTFHYVADSFAIRWISKLPLGIGWLGYYCWQWYAGLTARELHRKHRFEICHQVTFCSWRAPSFLWLLGIPFVWGPVGGGGDTPSAFASILGFHGTVYEFCRRWGQRIAKWDPLLRTTMRRANAIVCANENTLERIPAIHHSKCRIVWEMGVDGAQPDDLAATRSDSETLRVIWIGRLIPQKGLPLLLGAIARLDPTVRLEATVVGDGPDRARCERIARESGIEGVVRFTGWVPYSEVERAPAESRRLGLHEPARDSRTRAVGGGHSGDPSGQPGSARAR